MKTMNDIRAMLQTNPMLQIPADIQENIPLIEQGFDSLDMIMLLHAVKEHFWSETAEIPGFVAPSVSICSIRIASSDYASKPASAIPKSLTRKAGIGAEKAPGAASADRGCPIGRRAAAPCCGSQANCCRLRSIKSNFGFLTI